MRARTALSMHKYEYSDRDNNNDNNDKDNKDSSWGKLLVRRRSDSGVGSSSTVSLKAKENIKEIEGKGERGEKREIGDPRLHALVIDLRGNPGGPLGSALDVAGLFLPRGTVLSQTCTKRDTHTREKRNPRKVYRRRAIQVNAHVEGGEETGEGGESELDKQNLNNHGQSSWSFLKGEGKIEKHRSTNKAPDTRTNLLLLTDERTASASEILVAALVDNGRATSFGKTTKGKNVAQALVQVSVVPLFVYVFGRCGNVVLRCCGIVVFGYFCVWLLMSLANPSQGYQYHLFTKPFN